MDILILGCGPAGMSCANVALELGHTPCVVERLEELGGLQRRSLHPHLWNLGSPDETGQDMTRRLVRHFNQLGATVHKESVVKRMHFAGDRLTAELAIQGQERVVNADALVIATGTRPFAPQPLAELARRSRRILVGPLEHEIHSAISEARVLILGGGDNAMSHAAYLAGKGNRVTVAARGRFKANHALFAEAVRAPGVELREDCAVADFTPLTNDRIGASFAGGGQEAFDWVLVMYGFKPNNEVLDCLPLEQRPATSADGHIHVDTVNRTSIPRLYAIGDITDRPFPSVLTAIAQGYMAARAIDLDSRPAQVPV